MDLTQFAAKMNERAKELPENVNKIKKDVAKATLKGISEATPVDTGVALSNWHVDINKAPAALIPAHTHGAHGSTRQANLNATLAAGSASIDLAKPGDTVHIGNRVHYVPDLNYGSVTNAPAGFIETGVMRGRAILKTAKVIRD